MAPLCLALSQFLQRLQIGKKGTLKLVEKLLQIAKGLNRRRRQPLDHLAKGLVAVAVRLQGRYRFIIQIHVSAHACNVRAMSGFVNPGFPRQPAAELTTPPASPLADSLRNKTPQWSIRTHGRSCRRRASSSLRRVSSFSSFEQREPGGEPFFSRYDFMFPR
jgi:hypothetical protein